MLTWKTIQSFISAHIYNIFTDKKVIFYSKVNKYVELFGDIVFPFRWWGGGRRQTLAAERLRPGGGGGQWALDTTDV